MSLHRKDYQAITKLRLREARALLREGEYSGAYHLAGIAIECAIKAVIAKKAQRHYFPLKDGHKYYVHDPTQLVALASLDLMRWCRFHGRVNTLKWTYLRS
jgi:hypothetical protein